MDHTETTSFSVRVVPAYDNKHTLLKVRDLMSVLIDIIHHTHIGFQVNVVVIMDNFVSGCVFPLGAVPSHYHISFKCE